MIKLTINNTEVPIKFMKFPAGETNVQVDTSILNKTLIAPVRVCIHCKFESNDDLINLLLVTNAVKNDMGYQEVMLNMPYFPYALKDPETDNGTKKSAKGLLRVEKEGDDYVLYDQQTWEQEGQGELRKVFVNGHLFVDTSLAQIRERLHG